MKTLLRILLAVVVAAPAAQAQNVLDAAPRDRWTASWITHPTAPLREPITLHFRQSFEAPQNASHYLIHVSADNRFILYLNGKRIGDGPARGDLAHWRYETYDLAPNLRPGTNILSATVWNFGVYAPTAQFTDRTALLVQGDTAAEAAVNTNPTWMVETEPGHLALPRTPKGFWMYMAAGPGEHLIASDYDWAWQTEPTTSGAWVPAGIAIRESIYPKDSLAESRDHGGHNSWQLVPDTLPHMLYTTESTGKVVRADLPGAAQFPTQPVTIPPNTHTHILLDRASLTTAYPRLTFSGGRGSSITLTYSEALYDEHKQKGDRDEVGTRQAAGTTDLITPDGGPNRTFEPLWWRTFRYLDLDITTTAEPVTLDALTAAYTAFPFEPKAHFTSSDPDLDAIWKIGWHTVELDAHETYMDTPYYEQLQYVGDTRLESMMTYAVTSDERLPRQAIQAFYDSRRADGLTMSRYPSNLAQYIPPFSLLWIGMLDDYARYRSNTDFVRQILPGTRTVLTWFAQYQRSNGLIAHLPDWSFVDWTDRNHPLPTYDREGQSCTLTIEYAGALAQAAALEDRFGDKHLATSYRARHDAAKQGILSACLNPTTGLIADSPKKDFYSQHSSTLAVLYDIIPKASHPAVMRQVLEDTTRTNHTLIPATYYFDYYIARALEHANMGDDYFTLLNQWRPLLKLHFTTWPETPEDTRSDSHAWSADPTFDLLNLVAGIAPASEGFASIKIEPHLGPLTTLDAAMPHEKGLIHVVYTLNKGALHAEIDLPSGLPGTFVWKGQSHALHSGQNTFDLNP
jgi:alpha-L-rhamnosidase